MYGGTWFHKDLLLELTNQNIKYLQAPQGRIVFSLVYFEFSPRNGCRELRFHLRSFTLCRFRRGFSVSEYKLFWPRHPILMPSMNRETTVLFHSQIDMVHVFPSSVVCPLCLFLTSVRSRSWWAAVVCAPSGSRPPRAPPLISLWPLAFPPAAPYLALQVPSPALDPAQTPLSPALQPPPLNVLPSKHRPPRNWQRHRKRQRPDLEPC